MSGRLLFFGLALATVVCFVLSVSVGPADLNVRGALISLFAQQDSPVAIVVQEIRLPRALLAVLVGGSLGLAGAALQGYLRNPLAEPGLIGVSGSAALGAVIALQTGVAASLSFALPVAALAGAFVSVILILLLAGPRGSSMTLILAGIAISALAAALTSLVLNLSPNPFAASEIVFWMMGSLADRSFQHVWIALPFVLVGWLALLATWRGLDALTLGEDAAETLGIDLRRIRILLVGGTASCVGASTAVAGGIGFVGLVVPHILRPIVGARPGVLMPASAFGGAIMVLLADIAVRIILPGKDLKLGVLTAIVGAPLFLHLIFKTRREFA